MGLTLQDTFERSRWQPFTPDPESKLLPLGYLRRWHASEAQEDCTEPGKKRLSHVVAFGARVGWDYPPSFSSELRLNRWNMLVCCQRLTHCCAENTGRVQLKTPVTCSGRVFAARAPLGRRFCFAMYGDKIAPTNWRVSNGTWSFG